MEVRVAVDAGYKIMSVTPFWLNANANSDIRWYSSDCIAVNEARKGHMPCIFLHSFVLRQNIRAGSKTQCIQVLYLKVKYLYLTCLSCLTKVVDLYLTCLQRYFTWLTLAYNFTHLKHARKFSSSNTIACHRHFIRGLWHIHVFICQMRGWLLGSIICEDREQSM